MFDSVGHLTVAIHRHPLRSETDVVTLPSGQTIAAIVSQANLRPDFGLPEVHLTHGAETWIIPVEHWGRVRPREGVRVDLHHRVHGPAAAAVLSSLVTVFAPTIAGSVFGLTAGTFAFKLATAAITVVGALAINALIPPAQAGGRNGEENFAITGAGNAVNPYGVYPTVLGRHRMYPPMTATGYTETVGEEIYWRGRFTWGHGPVELEQIKIGTTPITEFDDVELEFVNVDETSTLANNPGLADKVIAWRSGSDALTLYTSDIAEDAYSVLLEHATAISRTTQANTVRAAVDVSFQGLTRIDRSDGRRKQKSVEVGFRYRPVGGAWVDLGSETYQAKTTALIRFTKEIVFPSAGEYEIEVNRISEDDDASNVQDEAYLTAIRSIRNGALPSHDGIAEMAIRVRASEQLNNRLDQLNAVVQMLAPVWTGSAWSLPQAVRHPAWVYLQALRGPQMQNPVPDSRIDLDAFKAWADEEPHWTCDYVVDTDTRVADVLDIIAASGRAKRALTDLRYSIIRDDSAGPVRQVFTPRNSWGFKASLAFPKAVHGLRVRFISEHIDWQQDETTVYASGYHAGNATEFESLDLAGVVLTTEDANGGNAWRLGEYHLAQALARTEVFEWQADFEHLAVTLGDKVALIHDVPKVGIAAARITAFTASGGNLSTLTLDDPLHDVSGSYRLTIRKADASTTTLTASHDGQGLWTVSGTVSAAGVAVGDLVGIEETGTETLELLVTGIFHHDDLQARITAVRADISVADAGTGTPGGYTPSLGSSGGGLGPPSLIRGFSGRDAAVFGPEGGLLARIGVEVAPRAGFGSGDVHLRVRWRESAAGPWITGAMQPHAATVFTDVLEDEVEYVVQVRAERGDEVSPWVSAGAITATSADATLAAPGGWSGISGGTTITLIGPRYMDPGFSFFRVYAATADDATLVEVGTTKQPWFQYDALETDYTRYRVFPVDQSGNEGEGTPFIDVVPNGFGEDIISDATWERINAEGQAAADRLRAAIEENTAAALSATLQAARDRAALEGMIEERRVTLRAEFDASLATVDQQLVALADEDSALAAAITALDASTDSSFASVNSSLSTLTSTQGAQATALTNVETSVGDLTTSVSTVQTSVNGMLGAFAIEVNNNDHITGMGLFSEIVDGTPVGNVVFVTDNFRVVSASGQYETAMFTIESASTIDGVTTPARAIIPEAAIGVLSVNTLKLGYGAVSDVFFDQSAQLDGTEAANSPAGTGWMPYTINVPMAFAGDIIVDTSVFIEGGGQASSEIQVQVIVDGSTLYSATSTGTIALLGHRGISVAKAVSHGTKQVTLRANLFNILDFGANNPSVQFRTVIKQRYR